MKGYNLKPEEKEFSWGKMLCITVGEYGRGRHQEIIPFHCEKETANFTITETKTGKPKIIKGDLEENSGWIAKLSGSGYYTRDTYGSVYIEPKYIDYVEIISKGYGAFGDAGRIGTYYEFLLKISEGQFLKIRPAGGSSKIDSYWLYFDTKDVKKISKNEIAYFCDSNNLPQPEEEYKKLLDLASDKKIEKIKSDEERVNEWREIYKEDTPIRLERIRKITLEIENILSSGNSCFSMSYLLDFEKIESKLNEIKSYM